MKNDLTRDEWIVLNEFLEIGEYCYDFWQEENSFEKKWELLDSAREKIKKVAKTISY